MDVSRLRWLQRFRLISTAKSIRAGLFLVCFMPLLATAHELSQAEVTEDKGIFRLQFTTIIDAPAEHVRQVLTDFSHSYRLSSSIIESEVLPSKQADTTKIRTRVLTCAAMFCREVERVDDVRMLASGDLQATIVPELSEFRSGQAIWKITAMDDRSKVVYEATLEPDFYIPPVIGIAVISDTLKNEFISTFDRLERIAGINAERDWTEDFTIASAAIQAPRPPCEKKQKAKLK